MKDLERDRDRDFGQRHYRGMRKCIQVLGAVGLDLVMLFFIIPLPFSLFSPKPRRHCSRVFHSDFLFPLFIFSLTLSLFSVSISVLSVLCLVIFT